MSNRSFWPLFNYWEEHTDGIVPNEYEWPFEKLWNFLLQFFKKKFI